MNLFIDTNIYLDFYHYTSETLEELKKLVVAIENKAIRLFLTPQVKNEFNRNREMKIADAIKRFSEQKLNNQFPQVCKEYEEFDNLKKSIREFEEMKDKLLIKIHADIKNRSLGADKIINELFSKAEELSWTTDIVNISKMRMDLGNPPGKNGSYGDAVNWEMLLAGTPNEDLYFITDDKDFISKINEKDLDPYLEDEWKSKKNSNIYFFRKLSEFFSKKYPRVKMANQMEMDGAIEMLINSGSFATTHSAISKLNIFADYNDEQVNAIIKASIENNQISWIKEDPDVREFLTSLVKAYPKNIDPVLLQSFNEMYSSQS